MTDKYTVRFFKDDEYELVDNHTGDTVMQDTLVAIAAYLYLEQVGLI